MKSLEKLLLFTFQTLKPLSLKFLLTFIKYKTLKLFFFYGEQPLNFSFFIQLADIILEI